MSTPIPAHSSSSTDLPELRLKPREDRRIAGGHLWIFCNEVDTVRTPLTAFETGALCRVVASNDRFLGYAYVNPHALICARILGRDPEFAPGKSLIVHRLQVALALREKLYSQPFYRLVYGESDGLPGLVLDRFGDIVVGQIGTAGMEAMKPAIVEAVVKVIGPKALIWKNDSGARELEGLPSYVETAIGPDIEETIVEENGVRFFVPMGHGQKTGWFYDQAYNRRALLKYVQGRARARRVQLPGRVGPGGRRARAPAKCCAWTRRRLRSSCCSARPRPTACTTSAPSAPTRSTRWRRCAPPARSSTWSSSTRRRSSSGARTSRRARPPTAS